jgi:hypothetical protein
MDTTIKPEVYVFLQDLLADKGIKVDSEMERNMIEGLNDRLQMYFMQTLAEQLSETDMEKLNAVIPNGPQAIQDFITSKVPNTNELFAKAMADFRQVFLQN